MMLDRDEEIIKKALETIETPAININLKIQEKHSGNIYKKMGIAMAMALICVVIPIGALAATNGGFKELVSIVSDDLLNILQPIEMVSENNGIRMEVLGVANDNEALVVYFSLKDLTGERIDETILLEEYKVSKGNSFGTEVVKYDEATNTAVIKMEMYGGEKLNGKNIKFNIQSFLTHHTRIDKEISNIDINSFKHTKNTKSLSVTEDILGMGGTLIEEFNGVKTINVLDEENKKIKIDGVDFQEIVSMGIVDGRIHIQTKWIGNGINDHGYFYFVDKDGNIINELISSSISFEDNGEKYVEYIFNLETFNRFKNKDITLKGFFAGDAEIIEGDWSVKFKLDSVGEEISKKVAVKTKSGNIKNIEVSALGVNLYGDNIKSEEVEVKVVYRNGGIEELPSKRQVDNGISFLHTKVIQIEKINGIIINGELIEI